MAEEQINFLDYPIHYWDESNPVNLKLRIQMRERFKRISDRVENYKQRKDAA